MTQPDSVPTELIVCVVQSLAHVLWQGMIVLAGAWTVEVAIRGRSSRIGYSVWFSAMCLTFLCLPVNLAVLWPEQTANLLPTADVPGVSPTPGQLDTQNHFENIPSENNIAPVADDYRTSADLITAIPVASDDGVDVSTTATNPSAASSWLTIYPYAISVYAAGVVVMLLRLLCAIGGGRRLRIDSVLVVDTTVLACCDRCARRIGLRLLPVVATGSRVSVPIVIGIIKPMVVLPASLVTQLSPEQLEAILLHEFAHIRRWDTVMNFIQRLIETVLFFQPTVWIISRRVSIEREFCCDDLVIQSGKERCTYAESLVRVSELRHESTATENCAAIAAVDNNLASLRRRVIRVLNQPEGDTNMRPTSGNILAAAGLLAALGMACVSLTIPNTVDADDALAATTETNSKDSTDRQQVEVETNPLQKIERYVRQLQSDDWVVREQSIRALGELKAIRHVNSIAAALDDENLNVQTSAAYALGRIAGPQSFDALLKHLKQEDTEPLASHLTSALLTIDGDRAIEAVLQSWQRRNKTVKANALHQFRDSEEPDLNDVLFRHLRRKDGQFDHAVAEILVHRRDFRIADAIAQELSKGPREHRHLVAAHLAELGDARCQVSLVELLNSSDPVIQRSAIRSLGKFGDDGVASAILESTAGLSQDRDGNRTRTEAGFVLAAIGGKAAINAVAAWAADSDVDWRRHEKFVQALGTSQDPRAAEALVSLAKTDTEAGFLEEIAEALGETGDGRTIEVLGQLVKHDNSRLSQTARTALARVRLGAAFAVRSGDQDKAFELAAAGLDNSDEEIAMAAVRVLSQLKDTRVANLFSTKASDSRRAVRYAIYQYFSYQNDQYSADMLVRFTTDADDKIRLRSARSLAARTDSRAIDPLLKLSRSDNEYLRREAAKALGNYKTLDVIQRLTEMLSDEDDRTRSDAIKSLATSGRVSSVNAVFRAIDEATASKQLEPLISILSDIEDPRAIVKLTSLLAHEEFRIRGTAARALARRGWQSHGQPERLRYLAASDRRGELDAEIPPAVADGPGRVAGDFHLNVPISAHISTGIPEWTTVISTSTVEFVADDSGLNATVRIAQYSYPRSKWRIRIGLLGSDNEQIASTHIFVQTSGVILGKRLLVFPQPFKFNFDGIDAAQVSRFELTVLQEPGPATPGLPVIETSQPFESELVLDRTLPGLFTSQTARGDRIFRVGNVRFSLNEPKNNRRVVHADFSLHDEHALSAKWRLWIIFLDDEGKTQGRSSTTFLTRGHGNEAGGTIETATLSLPATVSDVWSPGGRFRFGVEFVPPSQDELAAQLAKAEGNIVPDGTVPLSHVDETAEDKRSLAASGHAVRFARPGNRQFVEAIQLFGSRYGTASPPKDDFHVYLLNEKFQVLSHLRFPYALIPRGDMKWHTLRTPSIEVPENFHAAVAFNPHRTKGIYLGLDESAPES